jgi:hypothetical protein
MRKTGWIVRQDDYTRKNLTACQQDVFALHVRDQLLTSLEHVVVILACNKVNEANRLPKVVPTKIFKNVSQKLNLIHIVLIS